MAECEKYPDGHHDVYSKTLFGFWVFLMTDFVLFGALFATYAVLRNSTFGGPSGHDLFNLHYTLIQSIILLIGSYTSGMAGACAHRRKKGWTIVMLLLTFILGAAFFCMLMHEICLFMQANHRWEQSAFLSMFYTIVATHGLHILFGLLWILVMLIPLGQNGITPINLRRVSCLRMFWQFLNIIWVFVFTLVYLLGGA
jgi:cytochrome o ubiquinol oxidase subunit III